MIRTIDYLNNIIGENKLHRGHATKILDWCIGRYGRSKYIREYPSIEFRKPLYSDELDQYGYFDDITNTIYANRELHKTLKELAKTIIEEYVHYLQSDREYQRLAEQYSYSDHPMEKEAKKIADKHYKYCLKDLKKLHRSFSKITPL